MQPQTLVVIGALDLSLRPALVAVLAGDAAECLDLAMRALADGADLLELRADLCVADRGAMDLDALAELVAAVRCAVPLPLLLTVRHASEGGRWSGSERERLAIYLRLLPAVHAVDLELLSAAELRGLVMEAARALGKPVVLSFHDFTRTPPLRASGNGGSSLHEIADQARELGADVVKIAATAETAEDVERLMRFTVACVKRGMVPATMSMGEKGRISRVLNPFLGSCFTYGYVGATATTQGQWKVRELRPLLDLFPGRPLSESKLEQVFELLRSSANGGGATSMHAAVTALLARAPRDDPKLLDEHSLIRD